VPTGMKHGVSTVPCASRSDPRRAPPEVARSSNGVTETSAAQAQQFACGRIAWRRRCLERERLPRSGMCKRKSPRVQRLTGQIHAIVVPAIQTIVDQCVSHGGEMHADLMRAAHLQTKHQFGMTREEGANLVVRDRGFAVRKDGKLKPIVRNAPD